MKSKYGIIASVVILAMTCLLGSCGKDRWEAYYPQTRHSLWIDSVMRANYLWNDELADEDDLTSSYFLSSVAFLQKVKYSDDQVSLIDTACSVPVSDYGYELTTSKVNDSTYMAMITYIEPATVAANTGLQRGEWIMAIDDDIISSDNIDKLTDGDTHKLMMGHYTVVSVYDNEQEAEVEQEVVMYDRTVQLPAAASYFPDDLPVVAVINDHIGYMLYNHIAEENQSKVAAASQSLAASHITDLVLDLRYAATGDVKGWQYLASLLAPTSALGSQLATAQFAESRHIDTALPFLTDSELGNGVNLGLGQLYVLTSSATAGPAEMLINSLKTVMDVVVIGQQTQGIGVACETFNDPVNDQRLYLAACQIADANGNADYVGVGITPDYTVNPLSPIGGIQPFGSVEENLLAKALALINQ